MTSARRFSPEDLCKALAAARETTRNASIDLTDEQWVVKKDIFIQPTSWDLGHIGWFAEFWLLRGPHKLRTDGLQEASEEARFFAPDECFDSAQICHWDRWEHVPYGRQELLDRLDGQLRAVQDRITSCQADPDTMYFAHLSLLHELMHVEALAWTRAECMYPAPKGLAMPAVPKSSEIIVPKGQHLIGSQQAGEFAFDNEMPAVAIKHEAFSIDSHPVRNDAFLAFVEDDGYLRPEFWRPEFWPASQPKSIANRKMPSRWRRRDDGAIEHRHYDQWLPLPLDQPVVHISAIEAEAYCQWAGRKLPTAAQWEIAAGLGMPWGKSVWEWTSTMFAPYGMGFRPGPYVTYSAPWFHAQREVRGGAYTTHEWLHDHRYRNFFLAERTDVFTGFRTIAQD